MFEKPFVPSNAFSIKVGTLPSPSETKGTVLNSKLYSVTTSEFSIYVISWAVLTANDKDKQSLSDISSFGMVKLIVIAVPLMCIFEF